MLEINKPGVVRRACPFFRLEGRNWFSSLSFVTDDVNICLVVHKTYKVDKMWTKKDDNNATLVAFVVVLLPVCTVIIMYLLSLKVGWDSSASRCSFPCAKVYINIRFDQRK